MSEHRHFRTLVGAIARLQFFWIGEGGSGRPEDVECRLAEDNVTVSVYAHRDGQDPIITNFELPEPTTEAEFDLRYSRYFSRSLSGAEDDL